jgi:hypothetical protein
MHPSYRANHFSADVIGAGKEHQFNYWEASSGQFPLQFQGPVLEFPPYGQSMMEWKSMVAGLGGIDLDYIFSLPSKCTPIPQQDLYEHR